MAMEKAQKMTAAVIVVILLVIAWWIAPMFFPMYLWLEVDLKREAEKAGVSVEELSREYEIIIRYNPRENDDRDPAPWEILEMTPEWIDHANDDWERIDEYLTAVRCIAISDKTGAPPNKLFIGSFAKDRYFRCFGIRLKPGALGNSSPRPIFLFKGSSWEKLDPSLTFNYHKGRKYEFIDDMTDQYDDYWEPPEPEPEEDEEADSESE